MSSFFHFRLTSCIEYLFVILGLLLSLEISSSAFTSALVELQQSSYCYPKSDYTSNGNQVLDVSKIYTNNNGVSSPADKISIGPSSYDGSSQATNTWSNCVVLIQNTNFKYIEITQPMTDSIIIFDNVTLDLGPAWSSSSSSDNNNNNPLLCFLKQYKVTTGIYAAMNSVELIIKNSNFTHDPISHSCSTLSREIGVFKNNASLINFDFTVKNSHFLLGNVLEHIRFFNFQDDKDDQKITALNTVRIENSMFKIQRMSKDNSVLDFASTTQSETGTHRNGEPPLKLMIFEYNHVAMTESYLEPQSSNFFNEVVLRNIQAIHFDHLQDQLDLRVKKNYFFAAQGHCNASYMPETRTFCSSSATTTLRLIRLEYGLQNTRNLEFESNNIIAGNRLFRSFGLAAYRTFHFSDLGGLFVSTGDDGVTMRRSQFIVFNNSMMATEESGPNEAIGQYQTVRIQRGMLYFVTSVGSSEIFHVSSSSSFSAISITHNKIEDRSRARKHPRLGSTLCSPVYSDEDPSSILYSAITQPDTITIVYFVSQKIELMHNVLLNISSNTIIDHKLTLPSSRTYFNSRFCDFSKTAIFHCSASTRNVILEKWTMHRLVFSNNTVDAHPVAQTVEIAVFEIDLGRNLLNFTSGITFSENSIYMSNPMNLNNTAVLRVAIAQIDSEFEFNDNVPHPRLQIMNGDDFDISNSKIVFAPLQRYSFGNLYAHILEFMLTPLVNRTTLRYTYSSFVFHKGGSLILSNLKIEVENILWIKPVNPLFSDSYISKMVLNFASTTLYDRSGSSLSTANSVILRNCTINAWFHPTLFKFISERKFVSDEFNNNNITDGEDEFLAQYNTNHYDLDPNENVPRYEFLRVEMYGSSLTPDNLPYRINSFILEDCHLNLVGDYYSSVGSSSSSSSSLSFLKFLSAIDNDSFIESPFPLHQVKIQLMSPRDTSGGAIHNLNMKSTSIQQQAIAPLSSIDVRLATRLTTIHANISDSFVLLRRNLFPVRPPSSVTSDAEHLVRLVYLAPIHSLLSVNNTILLENCTITGVDASLVMLDNPIDKNNNPDDMIRMTGPDLPFSVSVWQSKIEIRGMNMFSPLFNSEASSRVSSNVNHDDYEFAQNKILSAKVRRSYSQFLYHSSAFPQQLTDAITGSILKLGTFMFFEPNNDEIVVQITSVSFDVSDCEIIYIIDEYFDRPFLPSSSSSPRYLGPSKAFSIVDLSYQILTPSTIDVFLLKFSGNRVKTAVVEPGESSSSSWLKPHFSESNNNNAINSCVVSAFRVLWSYIGSDKSIRKVLRQSAAIFVHNNTIDLQNLASSRFTSGWSLQESQYGYPQGLLFEGLPPFAQRNFKVPEEIDETRDSFLLENIQGLNHVSIRNNSWTSVYTDCVDNVSFFGRYYSLLEDENSPQQMAAGVKDTRTFVFAEIYSPVVNGIVFEENRFEVKMHRRQPNGGGSWWSRNRIFHENSTENLVSFKLPPAFPQFSSPEERDRCPCTGFQFTAIMLKMPVYALLLKPSSGNLVSLRDTSFQILLENNLRLSYTHFFRVEMLNVYQGSESSATSDDYKTNRVAASFAENTNEYRIVTQRLNKMREMANIVNYNVNNNLEHLSCQNEFICVRHNSLEMKSFSHATSSTSTTTTTSSLPNICPFKAFTNVISLQVAPITLAYIDRTIMNYTSFSSASSSSHSLITLDSNEINISSIHFTTLLRPTDGPNEMTYPSYFDINIACLRYCNTFVGGASSSSMFTITKNRLDVVNNCIFDVDELFLDQRLWMYVRGNDSSSSNAQQHHHLFDSRISILKIQASNVYYYPHHQPHQQSSTSSQTILLSDNHIMFWDQSTTTGTSSSSYSSSLKTSLVILDTLIHQEYTDTTAIVANTMIPIINSNFESVGILIENSSINISDDVQASSSSTSTSRSIAALELSDSIFGASLWVNSEVFSSFRKESNATSFIIRNVTLSVSSSSSSSSSSLLLVSTDNRSVIEGTTVWSSTSLRRVWDFSVDILNSKITHTNHQENLPSSSSSSTSSSLVKIDSLTRALSAAKLRVQNNEIIMTGQNDNSNASATFFSLNSRRPSSFGAVTFVSKDDVGVLFLENRLQYSPSSSNSGHLSFLTIRQSQYNKRTYDVQNGKYGAQFQGKITFVRNRIEPIADESLSSSSSSSTVMLLPNESENLGSLAELNFTQNAIYPFRNLLSSSFSFSNSFESLVACSSSTTSSQLCKINLGRSLWNMKCDEFPIMMWKKFKGQMPSANPSLNSVFADCSFSQSFSQELTNSSVDSQTQTTSISSSHSLKSDTFSHPRSTSKTQNTRSSSEALSNSKELSQSQSLSIPLPPPPKFIAEFISQEIKAPIAVASLISGSPGAFQFTYKISSVSKLADCQASVEAKEAEDDRGGASDKHEEGNVLLEDLGFDSNFLTMQIGSNEKGFATYRGSLAGNLIILVSVLVLTVFVLLALASIRKKSFTKMKMKVGFPSQPFAEFIFILSPPAAAVMVTLLLTEEAVVDPLIMFLIVLNVIVLIVIPVIVMVKVILADDRKDKNQEKNTKKNTDDEDDDEKDSTKLIGLRKNVEEEEIVDDLEVEDDEEVEEEIEEEEESHARQQHLRYGSDQQEEDEENGAEEDPEPEEAAQHQQTRRTRKIVILKKKKKLAKTRKNTDNNNTTSKSSALSRFWSWLTDTDFSWVPVDQERWKQKQQDDQVNKNNNLTTIVSLKEALLKEHDRNNEKRKHIQSKNDDEKPTKSTKSPGYLFLKKYKRFFDFYTDTRFALVHYLFAIMISASSSSSVACSTPQCCTISLFVTLILAGIHLLLLIVLRPFLSRLDCLFESICAFLIVAFTLSIYLSQHVEVDFDFGSILEPLMIGSTVVAYLQIVLVFIVFSPSIRKYVMKLCGNKNKNDDENNKKSKNESESESDEDQPTNIKTGENIDDWKQRLLMNKSDHKNKKNKKGGGKQHASRVLVVKKKKLIPISSSSKNNNRRRGAAARTTPDDDENLLPSHDPFRDAPRELMLSPRAYSSSDEDDEELQEMRTVFENNDPSVNFDGDELNEDETERLLGIARRRRRVMKSSGIDVEHI